MAIDYQKFKGRVPYASELFGVYQPLLGWKSQIIQRRLEDSPLTLLGFPRIFTIKDVERLLVYQGPDLILSIDGDDDINPQSDADVFRVNAVPILLDPPAYLDSLIVRFMSPEIEVSLRDLPTLLSGQPSGIRC